VPLSEVPIVPESGVLASDVLASGEPASSELPSGSGLPELELSSPQPVTFARAAIPKSAVV
jgi:hypothetical protein